MSFFTKFKDILNYVFGSKFNERETRSHKKLCEKFMNTYDLNAEDLKEIRPHLENICDKDALKIVRRKINRLIKLKKVKDTPALSIDSKKEYRKYIKEEFKRVYDLNSDKSKRIKKIIKNKQKFKPEYKDDIQYVVLPKWWDMNNPLYVKLARELPLDEILKDTDGIVEGQVPAENEEKWFSHKNIKLINNYYDKNPKMGPVCNQIREGLDSSLLANCVPCEKCIEKTLNQKLIEKEESRDEQYLQNLEDKYKKLLQLDDTQFNYKYDSKKIAQAIKNKEDKVVRKDLFDIEEKARGTRPRLKNNGFEYPHIIHVFRPDIVYHPRIFYPLNLARATFHKRHPRFKKNYHNEVNLMHEEFEAEEAYKKLMYKRYKDEVEMVENIIKNPSLFEDVIPSYTCTLVLNVDSMNNARLYKKCKEYKENKEAFLKKHNLCEYAGNIKVKREASIDQESYNNDLSPVELYKELKKMNEESQGIDESEFPEEYYTSESQPKLVEEGGIIKKEEIEDKFDRPININSSPIVEELKVNRVFRDESDQGNEIFNNTVEKDLFKSEDNDNKNDEEEEQNIFANLSEKNNTDSMKLDINKSDKFEKEQPSEEIVNNIEKDEINVFGKIQNTETKPNIFNTVPSFGAQKNIFDMTEDSDETNSKSKKLKDSEGSNNIFGKAQNSEGSNNLFGKAQNSEGTNNLFGKAQNTEGANNLFGKAQNSEGSNNLFGKAQSSERANNIFGKAQNSEGSNNIFGKMQENSEGSNNIFGKMQENEVKEHNFETFKSNGTSFTNETVKPANIGKDNAFVSESHNKEQPNIFNNIQKDSLNNDLNKPDITGQSNALGIVDNKPAEVAPTIDNVSNNKDTSAMSIVDEDNEIIDSQAESSNSQISSRDNYDTDDEPSTMSVSKKLAETSYEWKPINTSNPYYSSSGLPAHNYENHMRPPQTPYEIAQRHKKLAEGFKRIVAAADLEPQISEEEAYKIFEEHKKKYIEDNKEKPSNTWQDWLPDTDPRKYMQRPSTAVYGNKTTKEVADEKLQHRDGIIPDLRVNGVKPPSLSHIVRKPGAKARASGKYRNMKKPAVPVKEVDPDAQPVRGVDVLQYANYDEFYNVPEDYFTSQIKEDPPENPLKAEDPFALLKYSGLAHFPNLKEINEKNRNPPKYEIIDNGPKFENPEHERIYNSTDPKDVLIDPNDKDKDIKLAFFAPEKLKKNVVGINGYGTTLPESYYDEHGRPNADFKPSNLNSFANTKPSITNVNTKPPKISEVPKNDAENPFAKMPSAIGKNEPAAGNIFSNAMTNANPSTSTAPVTNGFPTSSGFSSSSTVPTATGFPSTSGFSATNGFPSSTVFPTSTGFPSSSTVPTAAPSALNTSNFFSNVNNQAAPNTNFTSPGNSNITSLFAPKMGQTSNSSAPMQYEAKSFLEGNSAFAEILNKSKKGGMFDSILKDSENAAQEDEPSVKYRNKDDEEEKPGFNFFN